jgi:signal transduction histidine kinase
MNMSLLEPIVGDEYMQRIIAETRQIARDCCLELRTISYLLHPPLLDEVGLAFAIEWFAEGFTKRTSIEVRLHIMTGFPRLDSDVETTLFRIIQEAMSNIYRHSGATGAWITLNASETSVDMEIRDNGSGFASGDSGKGGGSGGVGFAGMRERLAQFGGRLNIRSSPYGVSIVVTIDRHAAEHQKNSHRG